MAQTSDAIERRGLSPEDEERLDPHIRLALATWPQIDPAVEAIVGQIQRAYGMLDSEMLVSLGTVGLTKEEFKVLMQVHREPRSHGALCKRLEVSTGAMTNRLDKLEREGLVTRAKDPKDRRGVLIEITDAGHERLDAYMKRGADRERELLGGLTAADKRTLNFLLLKLLDSLRAELDVAPPASQAAPSPG
jgi:DNA-binding MarR family transcriptional regulator